MSIFGHFNNFFFAAHLLDIAMGFKTLRTILSSVTHNGKQVRAPKGQPDCFEKQNKKRTVTVAYMHDVKYFSQYVTLEMT